MPEAILWLRYDLTIRLKKTENQNSVHGEGDAIEYWPITNKAKTVALWFSILNLKFYDHVFVPFCIIIAQTVLEK